ncbi:MAG: tRNA (adenosine(37)-N6)-dimethylallyltransferase MiaA [Planctomycetia bacterium]
MLSGPTASGKTALSLPLARRLDAEIVSVDSMAVYRGLDIGTAKPTAKQLAAVPHHLVDVVEPGDAYSVARWLADAAGAVGAIRGRGRRVLFVGGTPLYLRALDAGLDPRPGGDAAVRRRLHAAAEREGPAVLYERLAALDPVAASRIHPHDLRRIVRGLEVVEMAGAPPARSWQAPRPEHPTFSHRMMVVDVPRRLLRDRIDRRVEAMFAAGLVAETRNALARAGGIGPTASQAAGYAEAIEVLAGTRTDKDAVRRTQERTRQLAKRQLTWLRSFKSAVWIGA